MSNKTNYIPKLIRYTLGVIFLLVYFSITNPNELLAGNMKKVDVNNSEKKNQKDKRYNDIYKLLELSYYYLDVSTNKAIETARQANELALERQDTEYIWESLKILGFAYSDLGDYQTALSFFLEARNLSTQFQINRLLAEDYNNLGIVYTFLYDFPKALESHQYSLLLEKKLGNQYSIALSMANIAITHKKMGQYDKALEYIFSSQDIAKEINNVYLISINNNTIANIYRDLQFYDKALVFQKANLDLRNELNNPQLIAQTYNNIALIYQDMKEYDKALEYINISIDMINDNQAFELIGLGYLNRGKLQIERNEFDSALVDFELAKKHFADFRNKKGIAFALNKMGEIHFKLRDYDKSRMYFEEALEISDADYFDVLEETYKYLSDVYKSIGEVGLGEQYDMLYKIVSDTISTRVKISRITDVIFENEMRQKQRELELLKRDNEIKRLQISQEENLRIFMVVLIVLVISFAIYVYLKYRKESKLKNEIRSKNRVLENVIKQLNATQEELKKALEVEKKYSDLKTRFISMVSHEYRTPLTVIQLSSDILHRHHDQLDNADMQKHFEKISLSVNKITMLMDDVLEISKTQSLKSQINENNFDIVDFCKNLLDVFRQIDDNNHHITFKSNVNEYEILSDTYILDRILNNLISNAIKFTPNGKSIIINLIVDSVSENILFEVKDEGIGIPEEEKGNLFDAFYRSKNVNNISGTGLGLSIVKDYIELLKGEITFESELHIGTTFRFTLPVHSEK